MLFILMAFSGAAFAQNASSKQSDKKAKIQDLVASGRYVFKARSAQSMGGHTRQLTSEYDLKITPDTIEAYLPYFGRAYSAPIDPSKGGIQFHSTKFTYQVDSLKKGGWTVLIEPHDASDVQKLFLSISAEGYASLNVTSTQRQPISFTGIVVKKE